MSDIAIRIVQNLSSYMVASAPWVYADVGGQKTLTLSLTTAKAASGDLLPGYIPREGALPTIESGLNLEGGGDYERLQTIKFQLIDQMANGTSMDAWLRSVGVSLGNARIEFYYPAPEGGAALPAPFWVGQVRTTRQTNTRLELTCESDLDTDPLGEIVTDSKIRPIVYGLASKVKLPAISQEEQAVEALAAVRRRVEESVASEYAFSFGSFQAAALVVAYTDPNGQGYVVLDFGYAPPDLTSVFPGLVVPSTSDWYLEVVSGKGARKVRRLKAGSAVVVATASSLATPYDGQSESGVKNLEKANTVTLQVDFPFTDPESGEAELEGSWSRSYTGTTPVDTWTGGTLVAPISEGAPLYVAYSDQLDRYFVPSSTRSYLRIVRKGKQFSLPINTGFGSRSPLYVLDGDTYRSVYNAEELFRVDGQILRVIPSATSATEARCYTRLDPDWSKSVLVAKSHDNVDLDDLQGGLMAGTKVDFDYMFRVLDSSLISEPYPIATWNVEDHICFAFGNPGWDLAGAEQILFCLHAYFAAHNAIPSEPALVFENAIQAYRPGLMDSWWHPFYPGAAALNRSGVAIALPTNGGEKFINSIPPGAYDSPTWPDWLQSTLKIDLDDSLAQSLAYLTVFFGFRRADSQVRHAAQYGRLTFHQMSFYAVRTLSLNSVYMDVLGPAYTAPEWTSRLAATPLQNGIDSELPIEDHAHAFEDIFRRHLSPRLAADPVDAASVEAAATHLWTKTQPSGSLLPESLRPKISLAITNSAPQVGDVCGQICRDGMLVGSRNGSGQRTLKAFLARSLLEEQDATISETNLFFESISEAPMSSPASLCCAPLIRYGVQGGSPTQYVQVLRPDAAAWAPEYTLGFPDEASAMRAWNICHRGWQESGVVNAREISMDSIGDIDSLLALIMQPRGTTFLDWISRPKRRLTPTVGFNHVAAHLPRGSRVKVTQWRYAPSGAWGTLESLSRNLSTRSSTLTLVMDLAP